MVKSRYFKTKAMPMGQQIAIMKKLYPRFHVEWKKNTAIWIGTVQPSAASNLYKIRIQYDFGSVPKVWVICPELKTRNSGERIPHIYPDNHLCLYLPAKREWTRDQAIAKTIVPWTSLWLYHYEIWLATGEWMGGGVHGTPELKAEEVE